MAFTKSLKVEIEGPRPELKKGVEPHELRLPNYGGSERDEIRKRVERFKAHQERFTREREDHAESLLGRIRPMTKP
ncbi:MULTISPECIES: hypothetical protein [Bradyrhizobium]|uniref:hypothetical protein n=1 Tax=Bradyrhizobium TaxID=374 RepID=UPI001E42DBE4|nr:hypothetical protein [Bradyrhizobium canariense]MBM7487729.1 hypothetical protein [Bradyrhizobium canariense]UFW71467.1 hypothetical protein BcanWU425_33420 [Bradyrhizobium canariense]